MGRIRTVLPSAIALALLVVVALVVGGRQLSGQLPRLTAAVESLGVWGPIVFIAAYALACVAFVPASLLTLGAGALFGVVKGTIIVFIGATLGATLAFLIARYIARDWVSERVQRVTGQATGPSQVRALLHDADRKRTTERLPLLNSSLRPSRTNRRRARRKILDSPSGYGPHSPNRGTPD